MKERRAFPRYPITFPVAIGLNTRDGAMQFDTECVNISRSSIEVSCDSLMVEALLNQDDYPHTARLHFNMPGDRSKFGIYAQVVTHRRLSQNHYYLVFVFNEFQDGSDEQLADDLREFEPNGFRLDSAT
jgi:hypothetical protein